jgi:hypothetical protein
MRKGSFIFVAMLALAPAYIPAQETVAPATETSADLALRERQRVVLVEMISLNQKIRIMRDNALKQDEYLRRQWAADKLSDQEIEDAVVRKYPELAPMQARFKELETEFKTLQKQITAGSKSQGEEKK